ncbi:hypothetical protein [Acidicapsa acidisoli]|uniref:hypothetical protein n=1 Tax=Acidicapsa acidisoli TaxID=1615681 RepID=UPI0021E04217|nr:hypothetical protein [Acidicapsa acidisoli]
MDFVRRARPHRFAVPEAISLTCYAVLVTFLTWFHQPWVDESQAWLLARDNSLGDIFLKRLHYEGTPGLWHLLLWIASRLHLSFTAMHWFTALIGVATAWVILRHSPFPRIARIGLPFIFGFVYQTAIIARSYSLVPLLAFTLCILLTGKKDRPVAFAAVAGLLANCALVPAVMSSGFVALYILRRLSQRCQRPAQTEQSTLQKAAQPHLALAGAVLLLLWAGAIYTALPAPDVTFGRAGLITSHPQFARALSYLTNIPLSHAAAVTPLSSPLATPAPPPVSRARFLLNHAMFVFYPISSSIILGVAFYLLFFLWIFRQRALAALLPFLVTLIACPALAFSTHHASLPLTALVATLWIAWDVAAAPIRSDWKDRAFAAVLLIVMVEQIGWTAAAVRLGMRVPFDGSRDAAQFIATEVGSQRIAGFEYYSVAVEPYSESRVFPNQDTAYWPWRNAIDPDNHLPQVVQERPAYILLGERFEGTVNQYGPPLPQSVREAPSAMHQYILEHGYHITHRFCGTQPAHFGNSEEICEVIFQPES